MRYYQSENIDVEASQWESEDEGPYTYPVDNKNKTVAGIDCDVEGWQSDQDSECTIVRVNSIVFDDESWIYFGTNPNNTDHKFAVKWAEESLGWLISREFFDRFDPATAINEKDWNYEN